MKIVSLVFKVRILKLFRFTEDSRRILKKKCMMIFHPMNVFLFTRQALPTKQERFCSILKATAVFVRVTFITSQSIVKNCYIQHLQKVNDPLQLV